MTRFDRSHLLWGTIASLAILAGFVLWAELAPQQLHDSAFEDGPIENAGAVCFGLSSLFFVITCFRSSFLRQKRTRRAYAMTAAWAALMFVFMGEEISWGQRIFGFETAEFIKAGNVQDELNLHNNEFVEVAFGGHYRLLTIMMFMTGLFIPAVSLTKVGRALVQKFAFPVCPLGYWALFVGAFAFGKYYHSHAIDHSDGDEMRELIMGVAMAVFALHGALRPNDLFRASADGGACRSMDDPSDDAAASGDSTE